MKRWHEEAPRLVKYWKQELRKHEVKDWYPHYESSTIRWIAGIKFEGPPCHCEKGVGSVRKRKPFDCGKTQCLMCHSDKVLGKPSRTRQKREAFKHEEGANG